MTKEIKVVHVPFTQKNPYQKLLTDGLINFRCKIYGAKSRRFYFLNITILNIIFKYWKPDIIHLHWHHSSLIEISKLKSLFKSFFFIFEIALIKILGIKFVWTVHNLTHHENRNSDIEIYFCKYIGKLADVVITHCESAKLEVIKTYKLKNQKKVHVVAHGNYIEFYENKISEKNAKRFFGLPLNSYIFLFFGELREYKGILDLIYHFKKMNFANYQSIYLIVAGKPKNNAFAERITKLSEGVRNIVLVLNEIAENQLQIYFNAASVVVFPYKKVLTSGAVLLAMSYGKAIIASRLGCIRDILDSNGSILYNQKDKNGLFNSLEKGVLKKSEIIKMGLHNLELSQKLSWEEISAKTYGIYLELTKIK